jgi:hypothetical protein
VEALQHQLRLEGEIVQAVNNHLGLVRLRGEGRDIFNQGVF